MQNYVVDLQSAVFKTFRCQKAANSLDIDVEKKSRHHLSVSADIETPYNIGLIVGASGSGKTTLCKNIFGQDCFEEILDLSKPVIDQFPDDWSYDQCAVALSGMGLTSVPCWIRPAYTLSNGQKARAEAALQLAGDSGIIVLDEWTSVVDRTVAKVMSHCVQKYARKNNRRIVLAACHYDIIDWLNPDWIIDCNKQTYEDRRSMVGSHTRSDRLRLDIKEVGRHTWKYFSKYHYLSENLPGGKIYTYGLFSGNDQIGFQCFARYVPNQPNLFHSNRTVIHPDYCGLGLGIKMIDECSKMIVRKGYRVMAKFSSIPLHKARSNHPFWKLRQVRNDLKVSKGRIADLKFRTKVRTYSYEFIWRDTSPSSIA